MEYMKKILTALAVLALLIVAASFFSGYTTSRDPGRVDGLKIVTATQAYADSLKAKGQPLPASVSLRELMTGGLLAEADVSGFAGMEVTFSLPRQATAPQAVLARARLADGAEIVALNDGSVQTMRK